MNRSFWSNVGSVKGKMLLGTAVVALTALTLFVVCNGGGGGGTTGSTPTHCFYTSPANCHPFGPGGAQECEDSQGVPVANCNNPGFPILYCEWTVGGGCNLIKPSDNVADCNDLYYDEHCTIQSNPCDGLSTAVQGSACCLANPSFNGCQSGNNNNRTLTVSAGTCQSASGSGTFSGSPLTITATPPSGGSFTGWTVPDGVTLSNAGSATTQVTAMTGNATVTATCSGGGNPPPGGDQYCQWDGDPSNCYILNGIGNTPDAAACVTNGGAVVPDCSDRRGQAEYCNWGWNSDGTGDCHVMATPNAPNAENPQMTNKQACQAFGVGGNPGGIVSTCTPPPQRPQNEVEYYCRWNDGVCIKITNPNSQNSDNPSLTNLQNCQTNSPPKQAFTSSATCEAWQPSPKWYCDFGPCVGGNGWNCSSGGCYDRDSSADECNGGTMSQTPCPCANRPPSGAAAAGCS